MKKEKFTELTSLHLKNYGNNSVVRPDPSRCCKSVTTYETNWPRSHQCNKPRGHGPEQAYCKIHDPAYVEQKEKKQSEKWNKDWQNKRKEFAGPSFFKALQQIAEGHNDPRTLALETIKGYDQGEK